MCAITAPGRPQKQEGEKQQQQRQLLPGRNKNKKESAGFGRKKLFNHCGTR